MIDVVTLSELLIDFTCTSASLSTMQPGGISSVPEYDAVMHMLERHN